MDCIPKTFTQKAQTGVGMLLLYKGVCVILPFPSTFIVNSGRLGVLLVNYVLVLIKCVPCTGQVNTFVFSSAVLTRNISVSLLSLFSS